MDKPIVNIQPASGFSTGLKELWQYRELFYFFTWRDIKVRYKQTFLGIFWVLLQPLGMMLLFTLLFSKLWTINTSGLPYPVFVLSGLILWNFYHGSVSHAGESMIGHSQIIKKIYFPRLIIPCSAILTALFDFIIAFTLFTAVCIFYNQSIPMGAILYFPAGLLIAIITATGLGMLISALNVKYRDFRYALPFFLQLQFFASQVIYPLSEVSEDKYRWLLSLNPMNASIEVFRTPFVKQPDTISILIGCASAILIFITGLFYFRKTEAYFADQA